MSFPHLNGLDVIILGVLGFTMIRGAFRGLVRESLGVAAVGGAYVLAGLFYKSIEPAFVDTLPTPAIGSGVSFSLTFVGFALLLMLLFRLGEHGLVRAIHLGPVNPAGGLVLGTLKGALMVSIILFVLRVAPSGEAWVNQSALSRLFVPMANAMGEGFLKALPEAPAKKFRALEPT
jgi:membrane protein required for colicin V production